MVKKYLYLYKQASQMRKQGPRLMSDVSGNILPLIALVCVCLAVNRQLKYLRINYLNYYSSHKSVPFIPIILILY